MVYIFADSPPAAITKDQDARLYCSTLLSQSSNSTVEIPSICQQFPEIISSFQKRQQERNAAIAFAGMRAGSGNEARSARSRGNLTQAQIQRRLTTRRRFSKQPQQA